MSCDIAVVYRGEVSPTLAEIASIIANDLYKTCHLATCRHMSWLHCGTIISIAKRKFIHLFYCYGGSRTFIYKFLSSFFVFSLSLSFPPLLSLSNTHCAPLSHLSALFSPPLRHLCAMPSQNSNLYPPLSSTPSDSVCGLL